MKRLSLLLTVLCAAGLPLTAAALDFGPGQRMLAAETSAPSLPSAHSDSPLAELVSPHRSHADDEDSSSTSNNGSNGDAKPATPTARRSSGQASGPATATPPRHGVLSWQSLLPGSIQ
ncbi:MAG TPA: hypothetical protein VFP88_01080 [Rhodanobacteraceae bacterium]|nr:hypothetical protein [Rhodanobacteraceae bacterium]